MSEPTVAANTSNLPEINVWMPTRESYPDSPDIQRIETARILKLQRHAEGIKQLIADHLPGLGITRADLVPGNSPLKTAEDFDRDYTLILNTGKTLYSGDGPNSVTPIIRGIEELTRDKTTGTAGLDGHIQGRIADFDKVVSDAKFIKFTPLRLSLA